MSSDIVTRLRKEISKRDRPYPVELLPELRDAADEIERLRAERDEARRSCCEYAAIVDGADAADGMESGRFYEIAMKYMKDRRWDCFKGVAND